MDLNATTAAAISPRDPNEISFPMVPAPAELVGAWEGSNCGLNDPGPVKAELQIAENGVNIWYFEDQQTGELLPQTGDSFEFMVGYQCVDIGRGYWWGKVDYSDVLWCNLFQVEEVESDEYTTVLSYTNLAYGGEGVGALSEGACPMDLTSLDPSMNPLQASFRRRIFTENLPDITCNVPADSKDVVQPSYNSQFPDNTTIPDPFRVESLTTSMNVKRIRTAVSLDVTETRLPVINESACSIKPTFVLGGVEEDNEAAKEHEDQEDELVVASRAGTVLSDLRGLTFAAAISSIFSLIMM